MYIYNIIHIILTSHIYIYNIIHIILTSHIYLYNILYIVYTYYIIDISVQDRVRISYYSLHV